MRFHFFTYVIIADIIKMYRQILMPPFQTRLQRILWRNDLAANVDTYELTTVLRYSFRVISSGALSIWPSNTLISSLAVQHAFFRIFMSMTCSPKRIQSTN